MTATLKDERLLQRSCSSDARGATTVFVLMLYDRRLFVSLIQIFSRSDVKRRFEPVCDA